MLQFNSVADAWIWVSAHATGRVCVLTPNHTLTMHPDFWSHTNILPPVSQWAVGNRAAVASHDRSAQAAKI